MDVTITTWGGLLAALVVLGIADFFLLARKGERVPTRRALAWTVAWTAIGAGFAGIVLWLGGADPAGEYLAGYLIERSLSIDNLFVFALIFGYFSVPAERQDRLLLLGIVGALVLRAAFIAGGAAFLNAFDWAVYVFGALLVYVAVHMARSGETEVHPERNPLVRMAGGNATLAVLAALMSADVVFAIDSIPAIFAITTDTFIVFAANAFSLLGMRPLYFVLAGALDRFPYLKYGLAAVLAFVGIKMLVSAFVHIPVWLSLVVIVVLLGASIVPSLRKRVPVSGPRR